MNIPRLCRCGSGLIRRWQYDARGIELCTTCPDCHERKMARYRQDVLTDPGYDAPDLGDDEPLGERPTGEWPRGEGEGEPDVRERHLQSAALKAGQS